MKQIKARALFRKISSGETIWQQASLARGSIVNPLPDLGSYTQVTDWKMYTGLKDKAGVEIYEGDIVTVPVHDTPLPYGSSVIVGKDAMEVVWDDKYFSWAFILPATGEDAGLCDFDESDIEVIGNIHENHDHLKTIRDFSARALKIDESNGKERK